MNVRVGRIGSFLLFGISALAVPGLLMAQEKPSLPSPATIGAPKPWKELNRTIRKFNVSPQGLPDLVAEIAADSDPCHMWLQVRNNGLSGVPELSLRVAQVRLRILDGRTAELLEDQTVDLRSLPGADTLARRGGETVAFAYQCSRGDAPRALELMVDVTDVVSVLDERNNVYNAMCHCER